MSDLYTKEHVEKLVKLAFMQGQAFEVAKMVKDAQDRLDFVAGVKPETDNMRRLRVIHMCKEKQDLLMEPVPAGVSEYDAACEQEASIHYLDADISAAS